MANVEIRLKSCGDSRIGQNLPRLTWANATGQHLIVVIMAWREGDTTSAIDAALRDGPAIVGEIAAEVAEEREGLSFARSTASGPCVTWNSKAVILFCVTQETVVLAAPGGLRRCVRFLRRRLGWNQVQLAAAVGRSQQWVSSFESGRTDASLGDVVAALSALEASVIVRASGAPPEAV